MLTIFPLKRFLRRKLVAILKLNRPVNFPFISGDAFRAISQHIFDENSNLDTEKVDSNDIVFVGADFIKDFFKNKHTQIKNKYILITHNGDASIVHEHLKFLDDKIIHWFARNSLIKNEKITPVPIGILNMFCNRIGKISDLEENINNNEKQHSMSYGFAMESGIERLKLKKILDNHKNSHNILGYNQKKYFKDMVQYSFTISPEGNGPDCHRTWEAMYLNVIPIVKRNSFIEYFKNLSLPMLIVDDWNEIEKMDEQYLKEKYEEIMSKSNTKALYINYWIDLILSKRN